MSRSGAILCPRCFKTFSSDQIEFVCMNLRCSTDVIPNAKPDKEGNVRCECGHKTNVRKCPHCHETLPYDILENDTRVISVVGVANCGKSYYVGSLLRLLRFSGTLSASYGLANYWNPKDAHQYEDRYEQSFEQGILLPGTEKTSDILEKYPPIVVCLSKEIKSRFGKPRLVRYNYSFFDAAGENFEDPAILASVTPYLQNSTAILLLLDPRQIATVGSAILAQYPYLQALEPQKMCRDILNNVIQLLRTERKLVKNNKFTIPLFITISKWDLIANTPGLLPETLVVNHPDHMVGTYDKNIVDAINAELRSLVLSWDSDLLTLAEQNFAEVRFFACSAWGTPGDRGDAPDIKPFRVEDPLLWQLHKDKMV